MRIMILILMVLFPYQIFAQEFPKDFIGHWEGELEWFQTGKMQKVKMQLVIQPTDTSGQYTWQIIYGDKTEDSRPYILKTVDTAKGHWVVDERNGIVLDQYWIGNRFSGAFTVQTSTILNSYCLEGKNLIAEFYSVSAKPIHTTGGTSQDVPAVDSYVMKSYQKAILKKKEN
jgi:hypothetical protein